MQLFYPLLHLLLAVPLAARPIISGPAPHPSPQPDDHDPNHLFSKTTIIPFLSARDPDPASGPSATNSLATPFYDAASRAGTTLQTDRYYAFTLVSPLRELKDEQLGRLRSWGWAALRKRLGYMHIGIVVGRAGKQGLFRKKNGLLGARLYEMFVAKVGMKVDIAGGALKKDDLRDGSVGAWQAVGYLGEISKEKYDGIAEFNTRYASEHQVYSLKDNHMGTYAQALAQYLGHTLPNPPEGGEPPVSY